MIVGDQGGPRSGDEVISPNGSGRPGSASRWRNNSVLDRTLVADALAQLSSDYRGLVCRAYYDGWNTEQIATDLGVAEDGVKTQLHYALRTLQQALREMGVTR